MGYRSAAAYYSHLHDSITTICKSLLPFGRGRRLPNPLHKRHSDYLKWQQESFHRILHLIALNREGFVPDSDVSTFRTHLLDSLIAAPADHEPPSLLRDKLLFLQELLYANCISQAEYHSSKRPLIQRLAVQGVEIDSRDLVIATGKEEEWSVIDLRDKESSTPPPKKIKHRSPLKPLRNAMSLFVNKKKSEAISMDSPKTSCSVLMAECGKEEFSKKKSLFGLSSKEQSKHQWGIEGLRKWKRGGGGEEEEEETYVAPYSTTCKLVASPTGEGPDTKKIKTNSDFSIDHIVKEDDMMKKKKLGSRTDTSLCCLLGEQMEEKQSSLEKWVAFDEEDENSHPNLISTKKNPFSANNPFLDNHLMINPSPAAAQ